ncbi:MAG: PKD domain-containing protein [Actinomycetota bacterium]
MVGDSGPPPNQPPIPSFTSSCSGPTCFFDGSASSDDGTIASYAWSFGDTGTGSGVAPSHTYAVADTYTVTLTVTDNDGAQASTTKNVTASTPPANILSLSSSSVLGGSRWTANVTIAVTSNGSPVATSVSGTWSNGTTGSGTCSPTTCTVSKSGIRTRTTSVTFTVTSVGGSSSFGGTPSITVPKP